MKCVAIMRPADKLDESIRMAREMGFVPLVASPIDLEFRDSPEFSRFLQDQELKKVNNVIFTSGTGVQAALRLAEDRGSRALFVQRLNGSRVTAIGPVTGRKLKAEGIRVDMIPEEYTSQSIVYAFSRLRMEGRNVYVLRSDHGTPTLLSGLEGLGYAVSEVVVYILHQRGSAPDVARIISEGIEGHIDAFAFTSSLSATVLIDSWFERQDAKEARALLRQKVVAAIGPPTRNTLEARGIKVDVMPKKVTFEALLSAIKESLSNSKADS